MRPHNSFTLGFSPITDALLCMHPTASIQQPRSGPVPARHFLEPSVLDCISTFPNYNRILSHTPASQCCLPAPDLAASLSPVGRAPPHLPSAPLPLQSASAPILRSLIRQPQALSPLLSPNSSLSPRPAPSRSRYPKPDSGLDAQAASHLHCGGGFHFRFPSQPATREGLRPPIRELRTRPSLSLPVPAGSEVAGSGVTSGTSYLARAGAGGLYDGLGAPGAGGEGRAGAALGPEIRGGGGVRRPARPWPPPGLWAAGPRSPEGPTIKAPPRGPQSPRGLEKLRRFVLFTEISSTSPTLGLSGSLT